MKIAILGTRGIPNHYGGFEQFAEYLAYGLAQQGYDISVYNSHTHPYQEKEWNGVKIIHCNDPEDKMGTAGQFIYDLNCILDARKRNFDIILQLGYTSSTIWGWLLPKKSIITTNMDGLEWIRSKYSKPVRKFIKFAEYLGTVFSDYWISDSIGIQQYLKKEYKLESIYIPYGAFAFETPDESMIVPYQVAPYSYDMLVARLEPENNIETILEGVALSKLTRTFLVIGKHTTPYGTYLKEKYQSVSNIKFVGGVYDINVLNNLRYYSNVYFHGHSVGGTNPSLLEAMASQTFICANDNIFNRAILGDEAVYFANAGDVANVLTNKAKEDYRPFVKLNLQKIKEVYTWDVIIAQYLAHFKEIFEKNK